MVIISTSYEIKPNAVISSASIEHPEKERCNKALDESAQILRTGRGDNLSDPEKVSKNFASFQKPLHRIEYLIQLLRLVPFNLRIGTKPGELALGKSTGISF